MIWLVIVRSLAGNEGKIVRCLSLDQNRYPWVWVEPGPRWMIDRILVSRNGCEISSIADICLRPIRDQPGEDEILRIAGYPNKETA